MDIIFQTDCSRFAISQFLSTDERVYTSQVSKSILRNIKEYVPNNEEYKNLNEPFLKTLYKYKNQCYHVAKPNINSFSSMYFYFSMFKHSDISLYKWMKFHLKLPFQFEKMIDDIKPNVLDSVILSYNYEDIEEIIKDRMLGNKDTTFIYSGFRNQEWNKIKKYLQMNKSIVKLILSRPLGIISDNERVIKYFIESRRPILSLDISGNLCMDSLESIISCILSGNLKIFKLRNMIISGDDMSEIMYRIIQSKINSITLDNVSVNDNYVFSSIIHLIRSNKLIELNLIDTFPISNRALEFDLISAIGLSKSLKKIKIGLNTKNKITSLPMLNLISSIPIFNTNLVNFDLSGIDLSENYTIDGIFRMNNLRMVCLSYTGLNQNTLEKICEEIINSSVTDLKMEGIVIAKLSSFLFYSIRFSSLKYLNLNNSVLDARSFVSLNECKGIKISSNCFSDPLIQKLF